MAHLSLCPHIVEVRSLYKHASERTRHDGERWYESEHAYAVWLARSTGHSTRIVCACLAVLSPRCQWPRVKNACGELLTGKRPRGLFTHSVAKALLILNSQSTAVIDPVHAPKTWAFWRNLWKPVDPAPVTLDSWMFRAHGLPPNAGLNSYRLLADAYRAVASDLGLVPNQLQATVWLYVKEI